MRPATRVTEPVVHGIPNCDTVKRARAWLAAQGVTYRWHDFRKSGVPADRLDAWLAGSQAARLLNRNGSTWRGLDDPARASAESSAGLRALLLAQPSLIRRPVVDWGVTTTVGFDAAQWSALLAQHPAAR